MDESRHAESTSSELISGMRWSCGTRGIEPLRELLKRVAWGIIGIESGDRTSEPACADGQARTTSNAPGIRRERCITSTGRGAWAESEGGGDLSAFANAMGCAEAHDALFTRVRDPVIERMRSSDVSAI